MVSTIQITRTVATLTAALFQLHISAVQGVASHTDAVAVGTDLPETAAVVHYDISLRTDLDRNRLNLTTTCTIRNAALQDLEHVDMDLLSAEKYYDVKVSLSAVSRLDQDSLVPLKSNHACVPAPPDPSQEATWEYPRIARISLAPPLKPNEECRLRLVYEITIPDPRREDLNYRLLAELPEGAKEVCLLSDFAWIPKPAPDIPKLRSLYQRNLVR
jgi:hypothetical protein